MKIKGKRLVNCSSVLGDIEDVCQIGKARVGTVWQQFIVDWYCRSVIAPRDKVLRSCVRLRTTAAAISWTFYVTVLFHADTLHFITDDIHLCTLWIRFILWLVLWIWLIKNSTVYYTFVYIKTQTMLNKTSLVVKLQFRNN